MREKYLARHVGMTTYRMSQNKNNTYGTTPD